MDGYDVRYDNQDITPGENWRDALAYMAQNCTLCLAFHSVKSSESVHCKAELNRAIEYKRPVFSVYLENDVHLSSGLEMYIKPLQSLNWKDYVDSEQLIEKLETSDVFASCRNKSTKNHLLATQKYPIRECKIIFLGDGGSGKSSLITMIHRSPNGNSVLLEGYERILRDEIPSNEGYPTEGALMSEWDTQIEREKYRLRFLEFGGQQILWPMHNLLLTQKTVYVVVCDSSEESEEHIRLQQNAKHWLRVVNWYAPDNPVILVLNKTDKEESKNVDNDIDKIKLRNIISSTKFLKTSAVTGEGIEELIEAIKDAVQRCPHSFDTDVSDIERELQLKRTENHITYDVYRNICRNHAITEKARQDNLLNILVSLGSVCHYPSPENWIVVNPNWLTNGIYRIITDRNNNDCKNGCYKAAYIFYILENPARCGLLPEMAYNHGEAQYIINIMRMLHISYQIEHSLDMIPLKLGNPPSEKVEEFENRYKKTAIHLRWTADFLPDNIMHLIIAHTSLKSDHHFIWQKGGWFISNWCEALVEMSSDNNNLDVYVWSMTQLATNTKREYMDKIRSVVLAVISGELTRRGKKDIVVEEVLFWRDNLLDKEKEMELPLSRLIQYHHTETEEIHLSEDKTVSVSELLRSTYKDPEKIIQEYQTDQAKLRGDM